MTYCVGMLLDTGMVFLSDSRTSAGVDQISTFRKTTVFQKPGDRVILSTDGVSECPNPEQEEFGTERVLALLDRGGKLEAECWGKRSEWMDYPGTVEGQNVGIAIFDTPGNPRYPTYWHARGYGLFANNIFGVNQFTKGAQPDGSMTLKPGEKLHFAYRVVIHPGNADDAKIAHLYKQYTTKKK